MKGTSTEKSSTRTEGIKFWTAFLGLASAFAAIPQSCNDKGELPIVINVNNYLEPIQSLSEPTSDSICFIDTVYADSCGVDELSTQTVRDSLSRDLIEADTISISSSYSNHKELLESMSRKIQDLRIQSIFSTLSTGTNEKKIVGFDSIVFYMIVKNQYDLYDDMVNHASRNLHLRKKKYRRDLDPNVAKLMDLLKDKDEDALRDFRKNFITLDSLNDLASTSIK